MTNPNLSVLHEILEAEQRCCARLLRVSKAEQKSLIANNLKRLETDTKEMQAAVKELRKLHDRRNEAVAEIGRQLDLRIDEVSFHSVINRLKGDAAANLKGKLAQLMATSEALYKVNQQTIYLINFSIGLIDQQVDLWADALTDGEGYTESGASDAQQSNAKIIEGKV